MNKKIKKLLGKEIGKKSRIGLGVGAVVLALAFGLFGIANADSSLLDRIAQYAGQILGNKLAEQIDVGQLSENLIGGPTLSTRWEDKNGEMVYHLSGDFIDASTTIVSFVDPFLQATSSVGDVIISGAWPNGYTGASSTVEVLKLKMSAVATSTFSVYCAAAPNAYATSTASYNIIESGILATSTLATVENGLTNSYGSQITGGTISKIQIGPHLPYVICRVFGGSNPADVGGFTGTNNTFDGGWVARISKVK